jgi:transcription elongation factor Elf1
MAVVVHAIQTAMTRSGQHAYLSDLTVTCLACDWWGQVEAAVDEGRNDCVWTCPMCTTTTNEEWRSE